MLNYNKWIDRPRQPPSLNSDMQEREGHIISNSATVGILRSLCDCDNPRLSYQVLMSYPEIEK